MQKNKKDWTYIFIFATTLITIVLSIFYMVYIDNFIKIPECTFYKIFGIYCPGCGATRAVYSLYDGQILKSIYYNPIIIYIIVIDFWYLISEGISKVLKKENKFFIKNIKIYIYLGLTILTLNWIVKLIMLFNGRIL